MVKEDDKVHRRGLETPMLVIYNVIMRNLELFPSTRDPFERQNAGTGAGKIGTGNR